jgi:hypothetical protein
LRFIRKPPPPPSTTPTILLGSEAPPSKGLPVRDELVSDEEEKTCSEDDDFPDIDRLNQTNISVVGGSFSSTIGRIKSKRVKGKESWVFTKGSCIFRDGELLWKCNQAPCKLPYIFPDFIRIYLQFYLGINTTENYEFGESIYKLSYGPLSAGKHLKGPIHKLGSNGQPKEVAATSIHDKLVTGSAPFSAELFRSKLLRFIAVSHMPFSIVESSDFRDLMLYSSPHLRVDNTLLRSAASISTSLVATFLACQLILISMLQACSTSIHLSFDLWTSPNKYAFLGIVCYFIDY